MEVELPWNVFGGSVTPPILFDDKSLRLRLLEMLCLNPVLYCVSTGISVQTFNDLVVLCGIIDETLDYPSGCDGSSD